MKPTKVADVMVDNVVTAHRATPFKEVARLLGAHRISGLPVVDEGRVVGVLSETDLMLRQAREPQEPAPAAGWLRRLTRRGRTEHTKTSARTAGGLMTAPAVTVRADDTVREAARLMARHGVERLPVLDDADRLVGIVTRSDLLGVFRRDDEEIRGDVEQRVFVETLWLTPRGVTVTVQDGVVTLVGRLERRSEKTIAAAMTARVDGVVGVVDHLTYRFDDARLQPAEQALHGVADGWLNKL
ncbi:CBS domain-containing protein [Streptomyces sp. NPDC047000]|uniref:CBS domain-containing protein n=1 Tax=Streptomyces sp. NPDC047000 TaxID=3155474 RepID=UPI0033F062A3